MRRVLLVLVLAILPVSGFWAMSERSSHLLGVGLMLLLVAAAAVGAEFLAVRQERHIEKLEGQLARVRQNATPRHRER